MDLFILLGTVQPVLAQDTPRGPVYVVQSGDTLNLIAQRFGVSVNHLINVNAIADPNILNAGSELIIPGLEGVDGKLVTQIVPLRAVTRNPQPFLPGTGTHVNQTE